MDYDPITGRAIIRDNEIKVGFEALGIEDAWNRKSDLDHEIRYLGAAATEGLMVNLTEIALRRRPASEETVVIARQMVMQYRLENMRYRHLLQQSIGDEKKLSTRRGRLGRRALFGSEK